MLLSVCFWFSGSTKFYTVHLGKRALNETDGSSEQRFTVEKLIKHEEYDDISFNNDIGEHKHIIMKRLSIYTHIRRYCVLKIYMCIYLYISALIKLKSKTGGCAVKSPSARIACLPPLNTKLPPGFTCSIAGFGKESSGKYCRTSYY